MRRIVDVPRAVFLGLLAVVALGCGAVEVRPFEEFAKAVGEVRQGADDALKHNAEQARARVVSELVQDSVAAPREVAVKYTLRQRQADPLEIAHEGLPLFFEARWFREGVYGLNTSIVDYAALLHELAKPELLPQEKFDKLAKQLNANLRDAAKALPAQKPIDPHKIGLFATAASGVTQSAIEWRRRRHLQRAIRDNQGAIDAVALLGRDAVNLAATQLWQEYGLRNQPLLVVLVTPRSSASARKAAAKKLIKLNEEQMKRIQTLRTLDESYAALPAAHRELATALNNPKLGLESIRNLYDTGTRLHQLYEELAPERRRKNP
ncbi:MAG: hypothetical protein ACE5I7_15490 [Candidatus Binatia bacterium]